jgi:hypothetical protein
MKHESKFSENQQQSEQQLGVHETRQQGGHEFANADEMLRFYSLHTVVPGEIEQRLKQSAAGLPGAPRRSWWRNLLGG